MRGLGWNPDPYHPRDLAFCAHHPVGSVAANEPDMTRWWHGAWDQGVLESCVAASGAHMIAMACELAEYGVVRPSITFGWALAQAEEHTGLKLGNRGTYPRNFWTTLEAAGWVLERDCPYTPSAMPLGPTALLDTIAWSAAGSRTYRVTGYDQGRLDEIARALQARMPVQIGMRVDNAFLRSEGPSVVGKIDTGSLAGGHAMCVLAYRATDGCCLVGNSWGDGWRNNGCVWLAPEVVTDEAIVSDLWALSLVTAPPAEAA